jgi:5-methyltetrahydrofolate--homocysteine methyltransferase
MRGNLTTTISSKTQTIDISRNLPTVIIGERDQVTAGAAVLDVNAGIPDGDEPALLKEAVLTVMEVTDVPLCIDTADPEALSAALSIYEGKALVNSINGEERSLDEMLPLVKDYGAAVIGLCMDDAGIPDTPDKRLAVAAKIIERAGKLGIGPEDIVIDPLVLTMGADHNAGRVTLETTELIVKEFGVNITMGASNVSFGLPDRMHINAAFIAMSIHAGLTCPITNPLVAELTTAVLAADMAMGRDEWGTRWIEAFRSREKSG